MRHTSHVIARYAIAVGVVLWPLSGSAHEVSGDAAPTITDLPPRQTAHFVTEPLAVVPAGQSMGDVSEADLGFIEQAAVINRAQRAYAKLALRKASAPEVRNIAQVLLTFHTKANISLANIAQPRGIALPNGMDADHQLLRAHLSESDSKTFDRLFLRTQLHEHETALRVFRIQESYGKSRELRAWARNMTVDLERHRRMLQDLSTPKPVS